MPRTLILASLLIFCGLLAPEASAQLVDGRPILTLEGAQEIATAALAEAEQNEWNVVIVITDASGDLLHLQRMDDVQLGSLDIAQQKARTAALYRRPTKVFSDLVAGGNDAIHTLPNMMALEGGLPIVVDDVVIGAIGLSGVRSSDDARIGQAGIDALLANLEQ